MENQMLEVRHMNEKKPNIFVCFQLLLRMLKVRLEDQSTFQCKVDMLFFELVILNHCELHLILFSFDCYRRLDFVRFVMLDEIIKFHLDRIGCQQTL